MSLDKETVRKVAGLARIRMTDEELGVYAEKLNKIIGFAEQLNELDTANVKPLPSPVDVKMILRPDAVTDGGVPHDVLANAPEAVEGFYVVPKVVE